MERKLIILTDCGDTIIDEGTEVREESTGVVREAACIPGARETLLELKRQGHTIALVADGLVQSFHNTLGQNGLLQVFDAEVVSEAYGVRKPDRRMFEAAFEKLKLTEADKRRTIMVGNNIGRDVVGANRFGVTSVLLTWSPRYCMEPEGAEETPDYRISTPVELLPLVRRLEAAL